MEQDDQTSVTSVIAISFFVTVTVHTMMNIISRRAIAAQDQWRGKTRIANSLEYYKDEFLMHLYLGFFNKFTPGK